MATLYRNHYPPKAPVPGKPLGRKIEHDERSRAYAYAPKAKIARKSVRHHRTGPVLDQGDVGSCTGNATIGALCSGNLYDELVKYIGTKTPMCDEKTALALYSAATRLDSFPGAYPPDDTGSSGLAVAKAAQQAGWLSGYSHAFSADDALDALCSQPIIVGVDWYEGFDNPSPDGECRPSGQVRGGHELCVDEIDVENERVWFTNSWSAAWGIEGRAWWSWATFSKLLARDGDATILSPISAPAPVPTPDDPGAASFQDAVAAFPGLAERLVVVARRKKLTVEQYAAWRLAGELGFR
jgi:hypothetical protein